MSLLNPQRLCSFGYRSCLKSFDLIYKKSPVRIYSKHLLFSNYQSNKFHNASCIVKYYSTSFCQNSRNVNFVYRRLSTPWILHRDFKTSSPRYLHPVIWIVVRPVLKLVAVLTGRGIRKWWRELPKNKKQFFWNRLKEQSSNIAIIAGSIILLSLAYYIGHLEETPITKRWRFMAFNPKQLDEINKFELKTVMEELKPQILSQNHPATRKVEALVRQLLNANIELKEIKGKSWGISVIDSSIENAFVLPIGHVFVFTGMIKLCSNDDQLGAILAHEISHCLLNHGAENVSFTHLLDMISIVIIAAIWAIFPSDYMSLLIHWLYQQSLQILLQLPYNRNIEKEADSVGLQLAAKACFDVREISAFWSKMALLRKTFEPGREVEFLSTHPSHESRSEFLDDLMEEAIALYNFCKCPKLKASDPRNSAQAMSKALEIARKSYFDEHPKPGKMFKI